MKPETTTPPGASSPAGERGLVFLLCALAAIHVYIYAAAFPFFGPVDEVFHFDLVVRYSHGQFPRHLDLISPESRHYLTLYCSMEYLHLPDKFPGGEYPPPLWKQPAEKIRLQMEASERNLQDLRSYLENQEVVQPPLYYLVTGAYWRLGEILHFKDTFLLYGIRFLNCLFIAALVWLGYLTACLLFPERPFIRLGVPILLAAFPQSAFYSIENDVLSPIGFGVVFLCLLRWLRGDSLTFRLAAATGLALAATFLTKLSNLPLLAVAAVVIAFQIWQLAKAGTLRTVLPALATLVLCAGVPVGAWMIRNKLVYGDFSATAAKIHTMGWTHKPFSEWWHHPIFTPAGLWTYLSHLMGTFWQGEMIWQRQKLVQSDMLFLYTALSLGGMVVALAGLWSRATILTNLQRRGLWLSLGCFGAGVVFLGFLSIIYDFHECVYPSRDFPYFSSGRLILGAVIPFFLLFVYGLDQLLNRIQNPWARPLALGGLILFVLVSEITANLPAFYSQYNWFHM